jgi:hypothetical protein
LIPNITVIYLRRWEVRGERPKKRTVVEKSDEYIEETMQRSHAVTATNLVLIVITWVEQQPQAWQLIT